MMAKEPKKILVIKMLGVGDVIWTTPLLGNLRRGVPRAEISFLCRGFCAPLLANNPDLDRVIPFKPGNLREQIRFIKELRRRGFDLALDLFGSPRSALLSLASGAGTRIGFDFGYRQLFYNQVLPAKTANQGHEVDFHLFVLKALGLPEKTRELVFNLTQEEKDYRRETWQKLGIKQSDRVIGLLPTGGWACKRWPAERFGQLSRKLAGELGFKVLVFWGSPSEQADAQIISAADPNAIPIPKTSLREMAALLSGCRAVIGNDSGPLHLATALKVPVLAFYGPTNPRGQGPWGVPHQVLRDESLPCLGCNKTSCRDPRCMTGISLEQVSKAFERLTAGMN
jgi:lipopolysaccharide heptosyltransferase II